jgi:hypothetical protein
VPDRNDGCERRIRAPYILPLTQANIRMDDHQGRSRHSSSFRLGRTEYIFESSHGEVLCAAKDETSVEVMRPLLNSWAECSVEISCGKVDYDKSG